METEEGTMTLPAKGPAADPDKELMGKEESYVFDGMFPDAMTFEAISWLVWFCMAARIWGSESPSAREKA